MIKCSTGLSIWLRSLCVNITFRACWLVRSWVFTQEPFAFEQPKSNMTSSPFASVYVKEILSIKEAAIPENTKVTQYLLQQNLTLSLSTHPTSNLRERNIKIQSFFNRETDEFCTHKVRNKTLNIMRQDLNIKQVEM